MAKLFGTDGIRGEAGIFPLNAQTIFIIGRSLAVRMRERLDRDVRFVTGRDTRESGVWIESAFIRGAASAGAQCSSAGVITTPGVAFVTREFRFDLGIVISASHNPFYDNGLKAFLPSGKKIAEDLERLVEDDVEAGYAVKVEETGDMTVGQDTAEFRRAYLDHLTTATSKFRLD